MRREETEQITFTPEDLELLRVEAERMKKERMRIGIRCLTYGEKRYEFARDWAMGNHWNTPKSIAWAKRIKEEVRKISHG